MKIFLIIPYRNAEKWLQRCLDSITGDFQVILINDHSTDSSHEIAWSWGIERADKAQVLSLTDTFGVSAARNAGIEHALKCGADYITFLDADDTYAADAYEQTREAIKEAPSAPIIQLQHVREFPDGRTQQRLPNNPGDYGLDRLPNLWVSVCNKLFKADLIKDIRFKIDLNHGEDELFVLNCLKHARSIHVSRRVALHYHKDNPNSLSTTTSLEDLLGEQKALCEFADAHKDEPELLRAVRQRQSELWNNACYKRVFGG